jgi:nitroreductase
MQVFEIIQKRRSIRKYKNIIIPEEDIEKLIDAARLAPSAANGQNWKFVIISDQKIKNTLVPVCGNQEWVGTCSHVIVGIVDPNFNKWYQVDIAIALEHITLEATELGLGTCYIGRFTEEEIKRILKIPQDKKIIALLTIGYANEKPESRPRKKMREIMSYNQYE